MALVAILWQFSMAISNVKDVRTKGYRARKDNEHSIYCTVSKMNAFFAFYAEIQDDAKKAEKGILAKSAR